MPRARRGLHGEIVADIGKRIVRGDLPPGTTIDPDALELEFDVSRTVVREAVKVLEAMRLVEARPKRGTIVRPRSEWNLLDAEVVGWCFENGPDPKFLAALNEIRQIIEPAAARLAAARATDAERAAMQASLAALRADRGNIEASTEDDVKLHRAILTAAGNELLDRVGSLIEAGLRGRDRLAFSYGWDSDYLELHADVVSAIVAGDGDLAEAAMRRLVHNAEADTSRSLGTQAPHSESG